MNGPFSGYASDDTLAGHDIDVPEIIARSCPLIASSKETLVADVFDDQASSSMCASMRVGDPLVPKVA